MRRTASRLLALAALLAVGAAVAVVLLGQRGDDGSGGGDSGGGAKQGGTAASGAPGSGVHHPAPSAAAMVRNAHPQPDWQRYSGPVPIFRYHELSEAAVDQPSPELLVPPDDFHAQMDWLEDHGYEAVGLETVQRAWFDGGTLPAKPVVLSFDGVAGDLLSVALPDLRERGWPGVLVLGPEAPTGGDAAIEQLLAAGWELEAEAPRPGGEGRALERRFSVPVRDYAFPQGGFDEATVPAVEAAGYEGATTPGAGFAEASEPFDLPRITVFGLSNVEGFAEAMRSRGEGVGA